MAVKKTDGPILLCWIIAVVIVVALTTGMVVQSGLNELTQASGEINSVASVLDSVTGLRSLLISFSNQCSMSQESWTGALNTALGLLFLVSILGLGLLLALASEIKKNRRLTSRLNNR